MRAPAVADTRCRGIGSASFLADVGYEVPTALMAGFVTATLGAPASALGLIEEISDALAGAGRFFSAAPWLMICTGGAPWPSAATQRPRSCRP